MRMFQAVCVATTVLACSNDIIATDSKQARLRLSGRTRNSAALTTGNDGVSGKRLLRIVESANQGIINATGSMNETWTSNNVSTAAQSDGEERGATLSTSVLKLVEKKVPVVVTNLLTGNKKQKILAKFRVKLLESLPPEQAANLIFLKMPKNAPAKLPSRLPKGIKGYDFKIPGISNAIIRLKMEIWFYYRYPPSYAFKQLGLVGKGSGDVLHAHENYKYFKSYFDAWYEAQKHLIF